MRQLLIDFKKTYDSIRREVLCIVRVIISRRMRLAEHVARIGERRGVDRVLVETPGERDNLGDPCVNGSIK